MKIVQINAIYGDKSTGKIVENIDCLLQQYGYESYFVSVSGGDRKKNHIPIGNAFDYSLHALRSRIDGGQGFSSKLATSLLIRRLEDIRPDILHLHNIHSNFLNLPILFGFAHKNSIAVILTLHDCWFFTGKCYHFADIDCYRWKTGCGKCPKKMLDIPSYLYDSSSDLWNKKRDMYKGVKLNVVGCSKWIADCAKQSPLFENAKISFIHNGIDLSIFRFENRNDRKEFNIMTMANKWFLPENKIVTHEIIHSLSSHDRLIIVGCKEEQLNAYQDYRNIHTYGYINDSKSLSSLYAKADLFLNLTNIDTLPTVNMEAAACGTPVITYDNGGSGELVSNGETGYIITPGSTDQLLSSIDLVRNGNIYRRYCREYAEKHFDKNLNYLSYLDLYQSIYH